MGRLDGVAIARSPSKILRKQNFAWLIVIITTLASVGYTVVFQQIHLDAVFLSAADGWTVINAPDYMLLEPGDKIVGMNGQSVLPPITTSKYLEPGHEVNLTYSRRENISSTTFIIPTYGSDRNLDALLLMVVPSLIAAWMVVVYVPQDSPNRMVVVVAFCLNSLWTIVTVLRFVQPGWFAPGRYLISSTLSYAIVHLHILHPSAPKSRFLPLLWLGYPVLLVVGIVQQMGNISTATILSPSSVFLLICGGILLVRLKDKAVRVMLLCIGLFCLPLLLASFVDNKALAGGDLYAFAILAYIMWPVYYLYALYRERLVQFERVLQSVLIFFSGLTLFGTAASLGINIWSDIQKWPTQLVLDTVIITIILLAVLLLIADFVIYFVRKVIKPEADHKQTAISVDVLEAATHESAINCITGVMQYAVYETTGGGLFELVRAINSHGPGSLSLDEVVSKDWRRPSAALTQRVPWVRALIFNGSPEKGFVWLLGEREGVFYDAVEYDYLNNVFVTLEIFADAAELRRRLARQEAVQNVAVEQAKWISMGKLLVELKHEINNALMAMQAGVDLLLLDAMSGEADGGGVLGDISQQVDHVAAILNDVGQMADDGERADMVVTSVSSAVRAAIKMTAQSMARHGVMVYPSLEDSDPHVAVPSANLIQIVANLLTNAREAFSPEMQVRNVIIRSACVNNRVLLTVRDNGRGITEDRRKHIFEPFFTTKPQGSGLGLSIIKSMVVKYGGELWLEASDPRYGSTFCVSIPVVIQGDYEDIVS